MTQHQLENIELRFQEGSSDKVYKAAVEPSGDGFIVSFAYGRRGATLNTGVKTPVPVPLDEAVRVYEKLVKSKTAKGYKPVPAADGGAGTGTGMVTVINSRKDTGLRAQLLNPIDESTLEACLESNAFCMQEKFDGRRMLLRLAAGEITAANRNGQATGYPEVIGRELRTFESNCVLDGECVGEVFRAFDLLAFGGHDLRAETYRIRLFYLQDHFGLLGRNISVVETITGAGKRAFLDQRRDAGSEGVVFKRLDAPWSAGRPASGGDALKFKFWETCSCLVTGINTRRSVELALGDYPIGNVTIPPGCEIPAAGQVVEVRYLYVTGPGGSLYQPVYLGVRDDIDPAECTPEVQHLKYKQAA